MKLLTKLQIQQLLSNGREKQQGNKDLRPVVKLFTPWAAATWLLSELDPEEQDIAFGLCDLGHGSPELGRVRLSDLAALRGPGGLTIERDRWFTADRSLLAYAQEARACGRIKA